MSYPVKVGKVQEKNASIFLEALGHVDSITSIAIKSRIEGELTGVHFLQGSEVKKGDLLFTIDPKPYEATLREMQALLQENLANLSLALEKVKRYKILAKEEYYSQIDYETLQANAASLTALVEQNKAQIEQAKINLDYCWIHAPIDGMMGILNVDYGNLVANNGTNLTTLNQMDPIFVTFSIPEHQFHKVQKKMCKNNPLCVLASFEDFEKEVLSGKLYMVDNAVNPNTGMIDIRAIFDNAEKALWPGQFVRIRLILEEIPHATIIPFTAVQMTQTGPVVFILEEDIVSEKKVALGQRQGKTIIVREGVSPGQTIVVEGQLNLKDKTKVEVH